jgi:hypothetical protein
MAAKRDPANHSRQNEPKHRVNSHVVLHGRPYVIKARRVQKAP